MCVTSYVMKKGKVKSVSRGCRLRLECEAEDKDVAKVCNNKGTFCELCSFDEDKYICEKGK